MIGRSEGMRPTYPAGRPDGKRPGRGGARGRPRDPGIFGSFGPRGRRRGRDRPERTAMAEASTATTPHGHADHHGGLFTRMREATGTVYGDIGTSVLYTVMEITRETVTLKHHHLD